MPSHWGQRTIDSLCVRVTSGGTPSRKRADYFVSPGVTDGVPWLKTKELADSYVLTTEEYITESAIAASSAKVLPLHTVVMAMYGATVGKLGMLGTEMACNQAVCAMVVDPAEADSRWLFYRLLLDRDALVGLATGSAQQNLSGAVIKNFKVLCPPLDEQRRIAGVLGALDDLIETNQLLIERFSRLSEQVVAQVASECAETIQLSTVASQTVGGVWGEDQPGPGLVPVRSVRGIDIASLRHSRSASPPLRFVTEKQRATRQLVSDQLVVEASGTNCGRCWIPLSDQVPSSPVGTVFSNFCKRFELTLPEGTVGPRFLQIWLNRLFNDGTIASFRTGTAMPNLDVDSMLGALRIPVGEQVLGCESALRDLAERSLDLDTECAQLARTRDELLPLLMSGRVSVREVAA